MLIRNNEMLAYFARHFFFLKYNICGDDLSMKKRIKKIIIIFVFLLSFFVIIPYTISIIAYNSVFNRRFTTYEPYAYKLSDFPNLKCDNVTFKNYKKKDLAGYIYYSDTLCPKGIVVIAHGYGGGGQNDYMDSAYYFVLNNYYVFAYDAMGNDNSPGKTKGLPQGVADLDYALKYVEGNSRFDNLDIMLFGHSWGAYSVSNVLNYSHDIKAVVSLSGFNESDDLLESYGKKYAGSFSGLFLPYVKSYEIMKFGKYAKTTSVKSFEKSSANVFIIHSSDDETIDTKYGYDIYYNRFKDDPKFKFRLYNNRGHDKIDVGDSGRNYLDDFNQSLDIYCEINKDSINENLKANFIHDNLDRNIWANTIDIDLYEEIIEFYDSSLSK